jgi:hypothetical protein
MTQCHQFEMWATQYDTQLPICLSSSNIKKFMKPLPLINLQFTLKWHIVVAQCSKTNLLSSEQGDPDFLLLTIYCEIAKCDSDLAKLTNQRLKGHGQLSTFFPDLVVSTSN